MIVGEDAFNDICNNKWKEVWICIWVMIQSDQLRHLIHFEVLKRKGVSEEKVESKDCLADQSGAKESESAWFSFHCVMDLEAISSTYP